MLPGELRSYYGASALLVRCLGSSKNDDYGRRAVDVLQKAVAGGLIKDPGQLGIKALRELKERDYFRRLLKALEPPRAG